jgi:adenylate cyclase
VAESLSLKEAAERVGVSSDTLRRWAREGLIPELNGTGEWTTAAVAHARIVARLRDRGHSLERIKRAGEQGRLAYSYIEDMFDGDRPTLSIDDAADATGLEPALITRFWSSLGLPASAIDELTEEDLEALQYVAAILEAGFPLVAFLQLMRVYGQAIAQMADAEVRLFHLYVHEPLMRDGVPGWEMAEEMEGLAREIMPLASPMMDHAHNRFLQHFIEQDVVGHLELEVDGEAELGRLRVGIAFVDLAGYTRLTEEAGEEEALDIVERFVESVEASLPEDARVVKTIGDEVMVVGSDPSALVDWAVGFQLLYTERPLPRIGIHAGGALYRDGDYYGRAVNLASRVGARAAGGEVLVTRPVVEAAGRHLEFEHIGEVRLKGFSEPTELFLARRS